MNVIRCKNAHFYDGDTYEKCPHCGESALFVEETPAVKESKKGLFGRGKKTKETSTSSQMTHQPTMGKSVMPGQIKTQTLSNEPVQQVQEQVLRDNPTLDFWQTPAGTSQNSSVNVATPIAPAVSVAPAAPAAVVDIPQSAPVSQLDPIPAKAAPMAQSSLQEAIRQASGRDEGKTMSYFSAATEAGKSNPQPTAEPVVGWLVCLRGIHFGESFGIYAGKNSIGRSEENRIAIVGDSSVSRVKHAMITYEPKKRNFYLQPGDSSGLTYVNEEYITQTQKLAERDVIELGDSKFLFVPLCSEAFSWEDHMPKGE